MWRTFFSDGGRGPARAAWSPPPVHHHRSPDVLAISPSLSGCALPMKTMLSALSLISTSLQAGADAEATWRHSWSKRCAKRRTMRNQQAKLFASPSLFGDDGKTIELFVRGRHSWRH